LITEISPAGNASRTLWEPTMTAKRSFIDLTFYETYYFANVVKNVLENQFQYIRHLDEFYGDDRYLAYVLPFPRFSAFHSFINFIIDDVLSEDALNIGLDVRQDDVVRFQGIPSALDPHPSKLPVDLALDRFGIVHESFETWLRTRGRAFLEATDDDVVRYYDDLRLEGQFEELLERATAEVFFVMFQNRHALLLFNEMMASQVKRAPEDDFIGPEYAHLFARPGALRRASIPSWVQRAVYFRDRGMCVICCKDISGLVAVGSEENYDHVVPLTSGGLNDITNIQLLCRECNTKKRAGEPTTSNRYETWYSDREHE
jgi:HNH endonuclease